MEKLYSCQASAAFGLEGLVSRELKQSCIQDNAFRNTQECSIQKFPHKSWSLHLVKKMEMHLLQIHAHTICN